MFRLHKYFAFFAVITVQLLVLMQARVISQCGSETETYKDNNNSTCNAEYPQVYCDGEYSAYCNKDDCKEEFECTSKVVTITTTVPTTTASPPSSTTVTTAIYRGKCESSKEFVEPYPGSSRYYYYCGKGYFGIRDCGLFMFFDGIDKKCKIRP